MARARAARRSDGAGPFSSRRAPGSARASSRSREPPNIAITPSRVEDVDGHRLSVPRRSPGSHRDREAPTITSPAHRAGALHEPGRARQPARLRHRPPAPGLRSHEPEIAAAAAVHRAGPRSSAGSSSSSRRASRCRPGLDPPGDRALRGAQHRRAQGRHLLCSACGQCAVSSAPTSPATRLRSRRLREAQAGGARRSSSSTTWRVGKSRTLTLHFIGNAPEDRRKLRRRGNRQITGVRVERLDWEEPTDGDDCVT